MEDYLENGALVLSKDNIASTDSMIVSAMDSAPTSAISGIMAAVKCQGPSTYWIEPWYSGDKIEVLKTSLNMDDNASKKRISFSCSAADLIKSTYSPEAFKLMIQNWVLWNKHNHQREQLITLLNDPQVQNVTPFSANVNLVPATDDEVETVKNAVMTAITDLRKRFQLGDMDFSVVGPYESAWSVLEIQSKLPGRVHFMGDDRLKDIFVFPTGDGTLSRAGLAYFEYSDAIQRTVDFQTGEEVFFYYNRCRVSLNPIHSKEPIINIIRLT